MSKVTTFTPFAWLYGVSGELSRLQAVGVLLAQAAFMIILPIALKPLTFDKHLTLLAAIAIILLAVWGLCSIIVRRWRNLRRQGLRPASIGLVIGAAVLLVCALRHTIPGPPASYGLVLAGVILTL
jgi:hypothetical protein